MEAYPSGPASFWLARSERPEEVEVAIVGGGIVGLSTAYWLARTGTRPVVLEAGHLAGRATGRNAGFLLTGSPEPFGHLVRRLGEEAARGFWELSRQNRELLRSELIDPGAVECEFRDEGSWLAIVEGRLAADEADELRASGERLAELGFEIEWHEGPEVEAAAGTPRVRAGLFQPRDGALDPVLLARGLARVGGFETRTGARVHALAPRDDGRIEIVADGGHLLAERVVVATNAYVAALVPELATVVRPVRGQMLATAPGERVMRGAWYLNHGFEYVRQLADGTVLAGGCRLDAEKAEVGYFEHPTATIQGALERFVHGTYPGLAERPVVRRWAGTMAFTPDGLPRVGALERLPGVLYAAGFNGHGMSLGFATGRHLARRLRDGSDEPLLPAAVAAS